MFWKAWKPNQQAMPAAATRPNMSSARARDRQRPPDARTPSSAISSAGADQAELLAGDGEDEVGVLLGHEARRGSASRGRAPGRTGRRCRSRSGPAGVVAGAARVEVGVGERHEPVDLVGLEHARPAPRPRPRRPRRRRAADQPAPRRARRPRARRRRWRTSTSIVPRSGCSRISAAGSAGDRQHRRPRRRVPTRAPPASPRCARRRSSAIPITTASLANSAGWIDMPAEHAATTASR